MILIILKTLPFLPFLPFLSKMNNFMQQLLSKKRRKSGKKLFLVFYEELTKNNNQFQQNSFWMHEKQSQIIYPATFSFQDHNIRKRIWFINWFSNFISPHRYPPQICNTTSRLVIKINSNSTRFTHTHTFSSCLVSSSRYGTPWNRRRRLERRHSDENTQWKRICEKNGMSMSRKKGVGEGSRGCRIESNLDWRACTKCGTMQQGECKARSNRVDQCTRGGMMKGKREKQIQKWDKGL